MEWGKVEVEDAGKVSTYKDCILWPWGQCAWDWNKTGTRHQPGIQKADFWFLADDPFDVIILSKGQCEKLGVTQEALDCLKTVFTDVTVYILESKEAVELYNRLVDEGKKKPVILLHSTC